MKHIFLILFLAVIFTSESKAQDETAYDWKDHWIPTWMEMRGSFLEPNRFATAFDFKPGWYRLEAGYGGEIAKISTVAIGAEGLIWSGLKAYKDFRFPVQTADYFFGLYSIFPLPLWGNNLEPWRMRFRISHISSHLVDGSDKVAPSSSSRFSREFVSLETLFDRTEKSRFRLSVGIKYVFHQVTDIEEKFQFPGVFDIIAYNKDGNQLFATISTAAGPTLANYSAGVTFRRILESKTIADLYAEYHAGRSRYGVESSIKQDGFEVGIRVGASKDLEKESK
jgi:hypothetical protein